MRSHQGKGICQGKPNNLSSVPRTNCWKGEPTPKSYSLIPHINCGTHTQTHRHTHTQRQTHTHTHTQTYTHTHTHRDIHKLTHTHTHHKYSYINTKKKKKNFRELQISWLPHGPCGSETNRLERRIRDNQSDGASWSWCLSWTMLMIQTSAGCWQDQFFATWPHVPARQQQEASLSSLPSV